MAIMDDDLVHAWPHEPNLRVHVDVVTNNLRFLYDELGCVETATRWITRIADILESSPDGH